jgi:hypothetical protein
MRGAKHSIWLLLSESLVNYYLMTLLYKNKVVSPTRIWIRMVEHNNIIVEELLLKLRRNRRLAAYQDVKLDITHNDLAYRLIAKEKFLEICGLPVKSNIGKKDMLNFWGAEEEELSTSWE